MWSNQWIKHWKPEQTYLYIQKRTNHNSQKELAQSNQISINQYISQKPGKPSSKWKPSSTDPKWYSNSQQKTRNHPLPTDFLDPKIFYKIYGLLFNESYRVSIMHGKTAGTTFLQSQKLKHLNLPSHIKTEDSSLYSSLYYNLKCQ